MGTRARLAAVLGILIVALVACGDGSKAPPATSHTPTPTVSIKPKPALAGDYTVRATPCANFRKTPELGVNIIMCVPNGSTVTADGQSRKNAGYVWYHLTYKTQSGWIANQYLQRAGASASASAT
jgi:uncharacterized protein YgiM (DUF1202 family)